MTAQGRVETGTARRERAALGCACASARQVARIITQLYDHELRRADIEAPQFAMMMTLQHHGPSSQAELGALHALDKTTVSRNVKGLVRKGWVALTPSEDRRERRVVLTPVGRERVVQARAEWQLAQQALRSAMTDAQWRRMFDTFKTVADAAQRAQRQTRPEVRSPRRRSHP